MTEGWASWYIGIIIGFFIVLAIVLAIPDQFWNEIENCLELRPYGEC